MSPKPVTTARAFDAVAAWAAPSQSSMLACVELEVRDAPDLEHAEVLDLLELDDALLVQLEHREEANDRVEPAHRVGSERAERDGALGGKAVEDDRDRFRDARADRRDVLGVDPLDRRRRRAPGAPRRGVARDAAA